MANLWCRLWHDMPNDPKWRTIARVSGQPIALVIATYAHLMVQASESSERGRTQPNAEDLASALDVQVSDIEAILAAMDRRVVEDGRLSGWEKRQPLREDGSSERAKTWRERNRTHENASEPERTLDKDKDTEKKEQPPVRAKREREEKQSDSRHAEFREDIDRYWKHANQEDRAPWDGSEAKELTRLLKAYPALSREKFRTLLSNRAKSGVNHGDRPREWLGGITRYTAAPVDRFNRPLEASA